MMVRNPKLIHGSFVLAGLAITACAHTPGKWESTVSAMKAPEAIVNQAEACDRGRYVECRMLSTWLGPQDAQKAVELLTDNCNRGDSMSCTLAEQVKASMKNETQKSAP